MSLKNKTKVKELSLKKVQAYNREISSWCNESLNIFGIKNRSQYIDFLISTLQKIKKDDFLCNEFARLYSADDFVDTLLALLGNIIESRYIKLQQDDIVRQIIWDTPGLSNHLEFLCSFSDLSPFDRYSHIANFFGGNENNMRQKMKRALDNYEDKGILEYLNIDRTKEQTKVICKKIIDFVCIHKKLSIGSYDRLRDFKKISNSNPLGGLLPIKFP